MTNPRKSLLLFASVFAPVIVIFWFLSRAKPKASLDKSAKSSLTEPGAKTFASGEISNFFPYQLCITGTAINLHKSKGSSDYSCTFDVEQILTGAELLANHAPSLSNQNHRYKIRLQNPSKEFLTTIKSTGASTGKQCWAFNGHPGSDDKGASAIYADNLYAPLCGTQVNSANLAALKQKLDDLLKYDNCIYGTVISIQNDTAPMITVIVKDCLLGAFVTGQTLVLQNSKPFNSELFHGSANESIGKTCIFAFSERYGASNWRPTKTGNKQHLRLDLLNIEAPFAGQKFYLADVQLLKSRLQRQRADQINGALAAIKSIWTKERLRDFCRAGTKGQSAEDDLGPSESCDCLLIPEEKKIVYPELQNELGTVTWRAHVLRGVVLACQITIDKGNDHWCPRVIRPSMYHLPITADDWLKERLEKTLSNVLTNHRLINELRDWSPPWTIKALKKDTRGRYTSFELFNDGKDRYTGKLDAELNIKAIYKNNKPDERWAMAFTNAQLNYTRYLQEYCSGTLDTWRREV